MKQRKIAIITATGMILILIMSFKGLGHLAEKNTLGATLDAIALPGFVKNIILSFYSNDPINQTVASKEYNRKNKNQFINEVWENGRIKHQGEINSRGQYVGKHQWYSKNERLLKEVTYVDGKKEGVQTIFYANGAIRETSEYKGDVLHGKRKQFSKNEDLINEILYEAGFFVTILKIDEDGGYYSGWGDGTYSDGSTEFEGVFAKGKPEGSFKILYPNGKTKQILNFQAGEQIGKFKLFWNNGNLKISGERQRGELHNKVEYFSKDGKKIGFDNYTFGLKEGVSTRYFPNGNLKWRKLFYFGRVIHHLQFDQAGNKLRGTYQEKNENDLVTIEGRFDDGLRHGKFKYYENGKLSHELTFKKGVVDGAAVFYDKEGKRKQIKNYVRGKSQGISTIYYPNGLIRGKMEYKNDEPFKSYSFIKRDGSPVEGNQKTFFKNDKIKSSTDFLHGRFHGKRVFYDELGKMIESQTWENGLRDGVTVVALKDGKKLYKIFRKGIYQEFYITAEAGKAFSGALVSRYQDGQKRSVASYINGRLNGTKREYYYNGKVFSEQLFNQGKAESGRVYYDWDGNILFKEELD